MSSESPTLLAPHVIAAEPLRQSRCVKAAFALASAEDHAPTPIQPLPPTTIHPQVAAKVLVAHGIFATWFAGWLGTLTYLCVSSKYARAEAISAAAAAAAASGDQIFDRSGEAHEHARASNNSTALVALVSLSCFLRSFKLSYGQSCFAGLLLLASTICSWVLQNPLLPIDEHETVMWTNLAWVIVALVTEIVLLRSSEKVSAAAPSPHSGLLCTASSPSLRFASPRLAYLT